jgi:hypothetical protein
MKTKRDAGWAQDRFVTNLKWALEKYEAEAAREKIDPTVNLGKVTGDKLSELIEQLDAIDAAQKKYEA